MQELLVALKSAIPPEVRTISRVLAEAGFQTWIVGGCVRDIARSLGRNTKTQASDWDLATSAPPSAVLKLFKRVIPTGLEHGTVTIVLGKQHFEVTTLRGERGHSDGRHPDEVFFVDDLEEDLLRRDMTVNAMAYNVAAHTFHDPFSGLDDLHARLLRAVGVPAARFSEDGLRVLRCARFCATLGFSIEEQTARAIRPSLDSFRRVAQERVRDEWFKALKCTKSSPFLCAILEHGLLEITFPQLFQNEHPASPRFQQALHRIDASPPDPLFRLALFCVLGSGNAADSSPSHSQILEKLAQNCAERMKLSREECARLKLLAKHFTAPESLCAAPSPAGARRYLSEMGREQAHDVIAFQQAVQSSPELAQVHSLMLTALDSGAALSLKELNISGKELIQAGIQPGPALGQSLKLLLEAVLEDPSLNEQEKLLTLATAQAPGTA